MLGNEGVGLLNITVDGQDEHISKNMKVKKLRLLRLDSWKVDEVKQPAAALFGPFGP